VIVHFHLTHAQRLFIQEHKFPCNVVPKLKTVKKCSIGNLLVMKQHKYEEMIVISTIVHKYHMFKMFGFISLVNLTKKN